MSEVEREVEGNEDNPDLVIIINNWFAKTIGGKNYSVEWGAIRRIIDSYNAVRDRALDRLDSSDSNFDWRIRSIVVCELCDRWRK